ncbi:MAG: hypothetical protein ACI4FY_08705 [Acetatifactor sp.]
MINDVRRDEQSERIGGNESPVFERIVRMASKEAGAYPIKLIFLCGSVTDKYDSFLTMLTSFLYQKGELRNRQIAGFDLLTLLSSSERLEVLLKNFQNISNREGRVIYIDGFHRLDYNERRATILLERIYHMLEDGLLDCPVVINAPLKIRHYIQGSFPSIWGNCIRYISDELREQDSPPITEHAVSPEPRTESANSLPWYRNDLELLKREKDGMAGLLKDFNAKFELMALPETKRLTWKLNLYYATKGVNYFLDLRIVYSDTFSRNNADVGIVVKNTTRKLNEAICNSKYCIKSVKDRELGTVYVVGILKKYANYPQYDSAAALVLISFLELLSGLDPRDVL